MTSFCNGHPRLTGGSVERAEVVNLGSILTFKKNLDRYMDGRGMEGYGLGSAPCERNPCSDWESGLQLCRQEAAAEVGIEPSAAGRWCCEALKTGGSRQPHQSTPPSNAIGRGGLIGRGQTQSEVRLAGTSSQGLDVYSSGWLEREILLRVSERVEQAGWCQSLSMCLACARRPVSSGKEQPLIFDFEPIVERRAKAPAKKRSRRVLYPHQQVRKLLPTQTDLAKRLLLIFLFAVILQVYYAAEDEPGVGAVEADELSDLPWSGSGLLPTENSGGEADCVLQLGTQLWAGSQCPAMPCGNFGL
ncbi:uncharacterized protein [Narcine bancroftii]|uniref:uncharacterized protein n=1 Tax=Narcine bancroftii TaxID=1343680 RepID=UPI00383129B4